MIQDNSNLDNCTYCGNKIDPELIIKINERSSDVICQYCAHPLFIKTNYDEKVVTGSELITDNNEDRQGLITDDLREIYTFNIYKNNRVKFGYYVTIFASRFIYNTIKRQGLDLELTDQITKMIANLVITEFFNDKIENEWLNKFKPIKKNFKKSYKKFQSELKSNQNFREAYLGFLRLLVKVVYNLMNKEDYDELQDIEYDIGEDLIKRDLFETSSKFTDPFRYNLKLCLSRLIYLKIKDIASKNKLKIYQLILTEIEKRNIALELIKYLVNNNKIIDKYLGILEGIETDDFNGYYEQLCLELNSDSLFAESFNYYLRGVIGHIHDIICGKYKWRQLPTLYRIIVTKLGQLVNLEVDFQSETQQIDDKLDNKQEEQETNKTKNESNNESEKSSKETNFEIYQTEKIQRSFSPTIHAIAVLSDKLRKRAIFIGRQLSFLVEGNKKGNCVDLAKWHPDLAQKILNFMGKKFFSDSPILYSELEYKLFHDHTIKVSRELKSKLRSFESYTHLYNLLKDEQVYLDLKEVYSPLPQQTLRYVADMWKSYRKGIKKWFDDPSEFTGKPNIPHYGGETGEFRFGIPGELVASEKYAKRIVEHYSNTLRTNFVKNKSGELIKDYVSAELKLPPKFMGAFTELNEDFQTIRTRIDIKKINEIRFIPRLFYYVIEIVYIKQIEKNPELDYNRALSTDIGLNVTTALTTNFGTEPILINGRNPVKSRNQWMNKKIARLRSEQTSGIVYDSESEMFVPLNQKISETIEMKQIRRKRNNVINTHFHRISRFMINYCLQNRIGRIAIGYNTGWKQNINIGSRNNQNFVYVPFWKLIRMIQYKAQLVGIEVEIVNESHTSKCSALDFESIEHHDNYLGTRGVTIKGRNTKEAISRGEAKYKYYKARGLFRSADGTLIHSDINASFNIGRRVYPKLFSKSTLSIRGMTIPPISVEV